MRSLLSRIGKLLRIVVSPGGIRALLTWRPFSITSFEMAQRMVQQGLQFRTIIDGGANVGQFARAMVETFPEAQVISFEPLPEEAATLRRNLGECGRWTMHECALGDVEGVTDFYRNKLSVASSALPIDPRQIEAFPETGQWTRMKVRLRTLDAVLAGEYLLPPVLLKLDLQGFELKALRGSRQILARCDAVLLEMALTPFYQGEALFDDLYEFMRGAGFRFAGPLDFLRDGKGEIVQMDALFVQR